ncbi:MAG: cell division protein FtsZ [Chitinophagales bacterium]|nr:cell division protein FtsZ [Chitinophagales bacterium]
MYFDLPKETSSIIKVIGVGGGGCNAVNHMFEQGIKDVNFVICNTDQQALDMSTVPVKVQLGPTLTKGRGAGSHPHMGKEAMMESLQEIKGILEKNTEMIFITAGMGGGTGTGGAPVIAKTAREMGILTIAIVSLPFNFEGKRRKAQADDGLEELKKNVDAILIISNDKLREMYGNLPWNEAFGHADDVLATAAKGIAEIITVPGYINVDFEDVKTVLRDSGLAIMGSGKANGADRARKAVELALASPLLNDNDISGAKDILLNITSGNQPVLMDEISEILEYVQTSSGDGCDIIWGNCNDESVGDNLVVTVIATGFETEEQRRAREKARKVVVSYVDAQTIKNKNYIKEDMTSLPVTEGKKEMNISLKQPENIKEKKEPKEEANPKQFVFDFTNQMFETVSDDEKMTQGPVSDDEKTEKMIPVADENPITEFPVMETEKINPQDDIRVIIKEETRDIKPQPSFEKTREIDPPAVKYGNTAHITNDEKLQHISKMEDDRIRRLKSMSVKMDNYTELEKVPAYLRRDVDLKETQKSNETPVSKYTVDQSEDEGLEIKRNNFLHDNVD